MKLFNVKVRMGGSVLDEVRRREVTAAEIHVLRHIHDSGPGAHDGVVEVEAAGEREQYCIGRLPDGSDEMVPWTETVERQRLSRIYTEKVVTETFGVAKPTFPDDAASGGGGIRAAEQTVGLPPVARPTTKPAANAALG